MKTYSLFIGLGNLSLNKDWRLVHQTVAELAEAFGGCSQTSTWGSWRNENNVLESELGIRLDVLADPEAGPVPDRLTAERIGKRFNQKCVLFTVQDVQADFVMIPD